MLAERDEDVLSEADMLARLLYRDALMLVVNKPFGVPVHRGPKGGPSLEDAFGALRFGLPRNPSLAHRLDRDTTGCLVLGRHRKALERLGSLFKTGRIEKTYLAVTVGAPNDAAGVIDMPLARRDPDRGWWMKVDASGQPSQTRWRLLARSGEFGLLELRPLTGRTHQLRVHCAAMGWPILGDGIYGDRMRRDGRQADNTDEIGERSGQTTTPALHLHAAAVAIPLYKNKDPVVVAAPLPPHMEARVGELQDAANGEKAEITCS